jgi:transposase
MEALTPYRILVITKIHFLKTFFNTKIRKMKEAITATAHKLAVIIYNMLTKYEPYKPFVREVNEQTGRIKKLKEVEKIMKAHNIKIEDINFSY